MADATVSTQEQIVREAPEIEAQKLALLQSAKAQVDATNLAAQQGNFLLLLHRAQVVQEIDILLAQALC